MDQLKTKIDCRFNLLKIQNLALYEKVKEMLSNNEALISPFSEVNIKMAALLFNKSISFDEYEQMKVDYCKNNKFLDTFELSGPRSFGETWAQNYLEEQILQTQKKQESDTSKKTIEKPKKELDKDYTGEYDFWYDGIKIEVKASRAVLKKSGGKLVDKALYSDDLKSNFEMNFQQIKPRCCDVFVWMGVWRDKIKYWVLSSKEVSSNKYFSTGQHRGNVGEGQLWITRDNIEEFEIYSVPCEKILETISEKTNS